MMFKRRNLRRVAVLFAIATVGVLAVGANAASAQVIEICKSSANGMSGRSFQYSISNGPSVSVTGGRCSGPIQVTADQVTVTEAVSNPATDVQAVTVRPSLRKLSQDLVGRSVTVQAGASTSSETLVTFTNQPAGGNYGTLKVCKLTMTPAYLGKQFSFSANGGPLVSTEANDAMADASTWSCRILGTYQVGSNVTVQEQIPAGTEVQFVDSDPAERLADFNTTTGTGVYTIGAGVTIALFDDEPAAPSGTGWLEICKDRAWLDQWHQDPDVYGSFHFTAVDSQGTHYSQDVLVDQCSEPFQVAAGVVEVTEGASPGYDLVDVATLPEDRLLTTNLINRTADVEVPVSDSSNDETQVHFFNQTQRGQLKICKTLGPGSSDLIGKSFYFRIYSSDLASDSVPGIWITAQATTQCKIVGYFPIGSTLDIEETSGAPAAGLSLLSDDDSQYIDTTGEGEITIAPGINTKTITNTAKGLLEICKAKVQFESQAAVVAVTQPTFQFRIDGGGIINVRAGTCTLPQRVSVGSHTVTEVAANDYELDSSRADGGISVLPADREVSRSLANRQVTVNVPFGPYGETLVTFTNRVKRATLKVCKVIPMTSQDSLGGKPFTYTVNGRGPLGPIVPGECTFYTRDFPIITAPNTPTVITVDEVEAPSTTFKVTSITVTGARWTQMPDLTNGTITFNPGPGINVVTYTNQSIDP